MVTNSSFHFGAERLEDRLEVLPRRWLRFLPDLLRELHPRVTGGVRFEADVVEQEPERDQVLAERPRLARLREGRRSTPRSRSR